MPSEYTSIGGGLKLKGSSIDKTQKKKKKKKSKPSDDPSTTTATTSTTTTTPAEPSSSSTPKPRSVSPTAVESEIRASGTRRAKTDAEQRYEEMRRKRLDEKLKRDGVKTHKEKVEELNKYLSGLSEHHDMPKIGPG
ncbi:DUF1754-domain-containing protein [Polyplosphaeria fusca]|uniref:DUF1754-domain-containing protein n=1 Tax=Polyplosphaeria fusca TaxID=682080 RepID=A0A9P4V512_9PLEO|nr:DUF1754-domain-containing protein [Polyplosphaeria fusca]